ncbi:MAG: hypothetical protein R6U91_01360 [Bacillota bacterium]
MEGIIFLFIIIIAFNLINIFLKAIKGAQGDQKKDPSTDEKQPSVGEAETKNFWEEETTRFRAKNSKDATADQASVHEERKEYTGVADDYATSPPGKSYKPPEMAYSLKKMLSQKESLAAAVVVHEILNHPKAMRRKRES